MDDVKEKIVGIPRIGDTAPSFEAITTHGTAKLEDFKGSWLILFSHPAAFTPTCTTEFIAFAEIHPELKKRGVELLGLSVDSNPSHIAWVRNIEEKSNVKITFPVIADNDRTISTVYGMIHPGQSKTLTVRCVFIIDPVQIIRTILYYPLTTGRNMNEIVRIVDALQATDKYSISTPANWKPGEMVIMPAPVTQEAAEQRMKENHECLDWYFCKGKI
jgi:peroxiredoxin (alkyl hydroperoxide reductase subunit C)